MHARIILKPTQFIPCGISRPVFYVFTIQLAQNLLSERKGKHYMQPNRAWMYF